MEGHLPSLKFIVGEGQNPTHILSARNNNGDMPKMLAQQFYKDHIVEYICNVEWERDHPEEAQSESDFKPRDGLVNVSLSICCQ